MTAVLHTARQGAILTLTLQRPAARNALSDELLEALRQALHDVPATVRLVLLQGAGAAFCAGGDLHAMAAHGAASAAANRRQAAALGGCFAALQALPQITLARVHGAALGGGAGLCAACDLVVASDAASFGFSEVRLGLVPATIAPYVIDKVGRGQARRLFLSGERLGAGAALALGLVHEVVEAAQLDAAVAAWCDRLLRNGPAAAAAIKGMLQQLAVLPPSDHAAYTQELLATVRGGAEAQQGIAAFFAKRPAPWATP